MYCYNCCWLLLSLTEFNAEKVFTVESDGPAKAMVLKAMMTKGVSLSNLLGLNDKLIMDCRLTCPVELVNNSFELLHEIA